MKFLTASGKLKNIPISDYPVDWDGDQGSKFSEEVLDLLRPYWKYDAVFAEVPVAGTRMRYDFVNISKKIIVETDGEQHGEMSEHFHRGSRAVYEKQIKNDLLKDKLAEKNGFILVRVQPRDMKKFAADIEDWFKTNYGITL